DVTEKHEAHLRIQEQAALLNQAGEAIIVLDLNRRIVFWNRTAERIYGWTATAVAGRDVREFFMPGGDQRTFDDACDKLAGTGEWSGEWKTSTPSGARIAIDSRWTMVRDDGGDPQAILMIDADVTEKRELETRFLRAQRVESLGLLAA